MGLLELFSLRKLETQRESKGAGTPFMLLKYR